MDNITHSLFAVTLANAGLRRAGRGTTAALVIASNIPDIEVLTAFTGGRVGYLAAHRGPTHGPLALALALAAAAVVWLVQRVRGRRDGAASMPALVAASVVGVVGHIAMDLATSYGTRVLSPFRDTWYGVDWMPIVDIFLWGVLAGLLAAGIARPERRGALAVAALVLTAGNYALRAGAHQAALREAVAIEARERPRVVAPGARGVPLPRPGRARGAARRAADLRLAVPVAPDHAPAERVRRPGDRPARAGATPAMPSCSRTTAARPSSGRRSRRSPGRSWPSRGFRRPKR